MNRTRFLAAFLFLVQFACAQTAPPADLATIQQNFKKLEVLGSVLYIAAHPDDENTRLLAYLAQEKHYRTGYLSMTRGDGGQNLIGNEQSELLGLIRTQELLAARRVDGAEQFFTRANDFGFSKGPDETLKIWDKEKVLGDVVWVIRKFRPDVMICRFPTTGEGGHGHHTSSAILAQEAFIAAADPKRFPEQLQYVQPWQARRLLWNTFNFGSTNTTSPDQFKIDVGVYNATLGKGYGELAAESRSNHKTQGFGSARQRGESFEYFKTILGDAPKTELMDGVNTTWDRVKGGEAIAADVKKIRKDFETDHPDRSVKALVALLTKVEKLPASYWKDQKEQEVTNMITACAGLWVEAYTTEPAYALGEQMNIRSQLISRYGLNISLSGLTVLQHPDNADNASAAFMPPIARYELPVAERDKLIPANELQTFTNDCIAGKISQPYWLESAHAIGTYNINNAGEAGNPENPDAPTVEFKFLVEGNPITITRKLMYKYVDPAKGEIYQPVEITPPVTANIAGHVYIFNSHQPQNIQVKLKSFKKSATGSLHLNLPEGWKASPENISFKDKNKGNEWVENFTITSLTNAQNGLAEMQVSIDSDPHKYNYEIKEIHYDHIPNITLFPPAQAKLIDLNLKIAGKKIGYINGAGDLVPEALKQVGYDVHQLTENDIINGDLSGYDAIITGVRAYNVNERLAYEQPKLLEYVKNGGNLVVQYNNNAGLVTKQIGPYPFKPVNQRVTDENATVTILDKQNPVLNYPNLITSNDFSGWVQERGLYFVNDIDPQYKAVLQMNDAGEAPNNGSLITGNYGEGRFIYTSLAFFRQLPAGVPGAYRLFINLLSKPKNTPLN
ncbi:PIG-L family deacetylase [Mucilaginibacter sp.]|uniref:PIG-L family deacetylase n=1 Tax=Mucilaginibacter sp. TaxID=1882438 RepID=UPI003D12D4AE